MQDLMVENDTNRRRRLAEFKEGCRYGKFGKTKAYELIARESIRAYKDRVRQRGVISAVALGHRQAAFAVMCRG